MSTVSLSPDVVYPPCPNCERNITGLFTERAPNHACEWRCLKCREAFDRDWDADTYAANVDDWRFATNSNRHDTTR